MKNIHVLPTDKPTWLHKSLLSGTLRKSSSCIDDMRQSQGMNIYIISNEEIKEGNWCLYFKYSSPLIHKVFNPDNFKKTGKKIILTTDADLIKDGVQTIPDEFLEWFVKNPSCEYVEIFNNWNYNDKGFIDHSGYKIITQNEEPNQDIIMELQKDPLLKDFDNQVNKKISFLKQKQETLEEVAKKSAIEHFEKGNSYYILGFENGAKYQLEQSFKLMSEYANYYEQCYSERPTKTPLQPSLWFEKFKNK